MYYTATFKTVFVDKKVYDAGNYALPLNKLQHWLFGGETEGDRRVTPLCPLFSDSLHSCTVQLSVRFWSPTDSNTSL